MNTATSVDTTAFEAELQARGCTRIAIVEWPPGRVSDEHSHDFIARGLILEGGFSLETPSGTHALAPGDIFEVAAGTPHIERVGAAGARILSGRLDPA